MKRLLFLSFFITFFVVIAGAESPTVAEESTTDGPTTADFFVSRWWRGYTERRRELNLETDAYRLFGNGAAFVVIQDTGMTEMVYPTWGFTSVVQHLQYRPRVITTFTSGTVVSIPGRPEFLSLDSIYVNSQANVEWSCLRRFEELPIALGVALTGRGDLRYYDLLENSALNGEISGDIGAAVRWERPIRVLKRSTEVHAQAAVPFVTWLSRYPAYNVRGFRSEWFAPWGAPQLRLNVGLSRALRYSDENRFIVDYRYDFRSVPDEYDQLVVGGHRLSIGYAMKVM